MLQKIYFNFVYIFNDHFFPFNFLVNLFTDRSKLISASWFLLFLILAYAIIIGCIVTIFHSGRSGRSPPWAKQENNWKKILIYHHINYVFLHAVFIIYIFFLFWHSHYENQQKGCTKYRDIIIWVIVLGV